MACRINNKNVMTTIDKKYDIFVKEYWEGVDEIKKTSERCAAILYKYGAPLTKEEWLKSKFNK